jgi:hypothetical protein
LSIEVDLVAEMSVLNPFDFFLEPSAERSPFRYEPWLAKDLAPFLEAPAAGPRLREFLATIDLADTRTIDFLVDINRRLSQEVAYIIRLEPGVQAPDETLTQGRGSCRDTGWLLVQVLRHLGYAARFVSGYLIQLVPDVKSLEGPAGPARVGRGLSARCGLDRARSHLGSPRRRRPHSTRRHAGTRERRAGDRRGGRLRSDVLARDERAADLRVPAGDPAVHGRAMAADRIARP